MNGTLDGKVNAAHRLVFRARNRLHQCIDGELREAVRAIEDLDEGRRLIYAVIARESPGLGGDEVRS